MFTALAGLILAVPGIAPEQMAQIVAERLQALDHLRIEYVHCVRIAPLHGSPLDRTRWEGIWDTDTGTDLADTFEHRITIVRPNALDEWFTDLPDEGYEPVDASVFDGRYVSRHVYPDRDGRDHYSIVGWNVEAGVFRWCPVLQVFDLHVVDSVIPQLNLLRLFEEYDVRLIRSAGGVHTYTVSVPMLEYDYTQHFEFDLNGRGTPLRFRTTTEYHAEDLSGANTANTREQFVLATAEVNGAELPTEVVVAGYNLHVVDYYGVHHIVVTSYEVADDLTAESVRIEPELRNSVVTTYRPDHTVLYTTYDVDGQIVEEAETYGPEPWDEDAQVVPRSSLSWRMAIPVVAVLTGVAVVLVLRFTSWRRGG